VQGLEEGRFFLRIGAEIPPTGLNPPATDTDNAYMVNVYGNGKSINVLSSSNNPIHQIDIYNVSGQQLYSNYGINSSIYSIANQWGNDQILIVRVSTDHIMKNVKLLNVK
jgi:hypothetical protein